MKINKYILLSFAFALTLFVSCSDDDDTTSGLNYVNFEAASTEFGVELGGSSSRDINLYSTNTEGSDRTYNVLVDMDATTADAAAYSVPSTITIPSGSNVGSMTVTVSDINIGDGKVLALMLEQDGSFYYGNDILLNLRQTCPYNEAALAIDFDSYSEESSWEILDASGAVVTSNSYIAAMDVSNESLCLEDGAYTFVFYDSYGDGLDGTVTLSFDGATLVDIPGFGGTSTSQTFTIGN